MLKKSLLATLLILPMSCWGLATGFYGGIDVGVDTVNYEEFSHIAIPAVPGPQGHPGTNVINTTKLAANGLFGSVFGGYGYRNNNFYIAAELNANMSNAEFHLTNNEVHFHNKQSTTFKINRSWGISAVPGIILQETTMLYARFGYSGGRFQVDTNDNSLANDSSTLNGVRLGLGVEKAIYKDLSLRLEYNHINYKDHESTVFIPQVPLTKSTTVSPNSNLFAFGVLYRFR